MRLILIILLLLATAVVGGYFLAERYLGPDTGMVMPSFDLERRSPVPVVRMELPPGLMAEPEPEPEAKSEPPVPAYEEPLPQETYEKTYEGEGKSVTEPEPKPVPEPVSKPLELTPAPEPETKAPDLEPVTEIKPTSKWMQNAVTDTSSGTGPMIAIVIDDMGLDRGRSQKIWELPAPLTLAFLTYADDLPEQTAQARKNGHELLVHVSMEPSSPEVDAGPNVLMRAMSPQEIEKILDWGLARFDGYVGINNHMGSRFTEDADAMRAVLKVIKERDLLFLDSRTSGRSVADKVASEMGVAGDTRNVFIDNDNVPELVEKQLAELEAVARKRGTAIAIGHPKDATLAVLARWLPEARKKGFRIVPLSALVARNR